MNRTPYEACADAWEAPSQSRIYDWARENVWLPASYAVQGEFHVELSNHLRDPFDAVQDESVRMVSCEKGVQTAGTLWAEISLLWMLVNFARPALWVVQTGDTSDEGAITRILPLMRACKALRRFINDTKEGVTKGRVMLTTGIPVHFKGPAESGLQNKSIGIGIGDECWLWEEDTIRQFMARLEAYRRAGTDKVLLVSQGADIAVVDGIEVPHFFEARMRRGTDKRWNVPCPHCLGSFEPKWEYKNSEGGFVGGMKWDLAGKQVHYVCPLCGQSMIDGPRIKAAWNTGGRYIQSNPNPFKGEESFHWNSLPFAKWDDLVLEFLEATKAMRNGSVVALRAFIQKKLAEAWRDKSGSEPLVLAPTGFGENADWPDEFYRSMTFDVQLDHFWVNIRAWARDGRSRLLVYKKVTTWEDMRALQQLFKVNDGMVFGDDAWGKRQAEVHRQCFRFGWGCMRGNNTGADSFQHFAGKGPDEKPIYESKPWRELPEVEAFIGLKSHELEDFKTLFSPAAQSKFFSGKHTVKVIEWAGNTIRDILVTLRDGKGAEWLAYDGVSQTYRHQMTGQVKLQRHNQKTNRPEYYWKVVGDDHAMDCECMQIVIASALGILKV